jgi:Fe-S-cluster containining protein
MESRGLTFVSAKLRNKWDLRSPYLIAQNADGYCMHFERSACACMIREHRPIPCRAYPAKRGAASATRRGNDQRFWVDFEKKIVSAEVASTNSPNLSKSDSEAAISLTIGMSSFLISCLLV